MTRMHIVSIVANRVAGDSRVIKTARAALNAGYAATIIGLGNSEAGDGESVIEGVRVVRLPNPVPYLRRHGLWTDSPRRRDVRLLVGAYARDIVPKIVELVPDVIHSHDMLGLKLGALSRRALESSGHQVGWVHDLHELVYGLSGRLIEGYRPTLLEWERTYLHAADHLITVSEPLAEAVAARYRLRQAPTVVHNVPYAGDFADEGPDVRATLGIARDVPLIVFVGGVSPLRGCETIVRAVAQLPDMHLAIVSNSSHVENIAELADTLGMADRFHTHPYVASDRVASFIRTADLGIHGLVHYPNGEVALPNKLFEYLHAGLPVVVSDVQSMRAFVEARGVGEVFTAEDVESCVAAIRRVLSDAAPYRARITPELLQEYSWERQEQKLLEIYRGALKGRSPATDEQRERAIQELAAEQLLFETTLSRGISEVLFDRQHASSSAAPAPKTVSRRVAAIRKHVAKHGPARTAAHVGRRLLTRLGIGGS